VPSRRRLWSISAKIALRDRPEPLAWAHRVPDLRGDHDVVAVGEILQRPADDLFAGTL
jgi:hypothetical protein